jgi:Outer membrane protein beta-barrel domain
MKKLALVILAGVSFATANAQFQFGVKAGANFASESGSDADEAKTMFNFNAGVFAKLPLVNRLSLQPELVYSGQGSKYDLHPDETRHLNYLNIPILLKYSAGAGFAIETGPQIGFLLSAKQAGIDYKNFFNSTDFSWAVGVAYRIPESKLGIDARYNFGIANIEDRDKTRSTGSLRTNAFQLGLTYVLFSSGRK